MGKRNPELVKKMEARKKFIKKVIKFAGQILRERGKVIERSEHSCHTHVVQELLNFADFSFCGDFGQTMFGGETVRILYHPNKTVTSFPRYGRCTFEVYSQDLSFDECKVEFFDNNTKWQVELLRVIRNKKAIIKRMDVVKAKFVRHINKTSEEMKNLDKLKTEARRLGFEA